jgi:hypothetical protein
MGRRMALSGGRSILDSGQFRHRRGGRKRSSSRTFGDAVAAGRLGADRRADLVVGVCKDQATSSISAAHPQLVVVGMQACR